MHDEFSGYLPETTGSNSTQATPFSPCLSHEMGSNSKLTEAEPRKVFFFDIDNCLYPNSARVHDLMADLIDAYFMNHLSLPRADAERLHREYYRNYGLAIEGLTETRNHNTAKGHGQGKMPLVCKPHADMYHKAMKEAGADSYEDCFFVDDSYLNCQKAQELGWTTVHLAEEGVESPASPASDYQIRHLEELRAIFPHFFKP
ncbi:hypothetical protein P8C59_001313 [Phyllachora maydis]|uniref:Pyrimidine 5-nucleotidase n=1 Tax=Phyllachora maydis TaxID=1825666 RepID=A0AAD9HZE6_9PEZI|nr:hypothetical protein P8C59_001313 [Phyllachora maydis]